jgi:hypothetical protein
MVNIMPNYTIVEAWIHEESKIIFVGRKKKLEEVLRNVNRSNFTVISETAQNRLGFKLRDFTREQKRRDENIYSVKFVSGLTTLDNVIRSYGSKESLFKRSYLAGDQLAEWIESIK